MTLHSQSLNHLPRRKKTPIILLVITFKKLKCITKENYQEEVINLNTKPSR